MIYVKFQAFGKTYQEVFPADYVATQIAARLHDISDTLVVEKVGIVEEPENIDIIKSQVVQALSIMPAKERSVQA